MLGAAAVLSVSFAACSNSGGTGATSASLIEPAATSATSPAGSGGPPSSAPLATEEGPRSSLPPSDEVSSPPGQASFAAPAGDAFYTPPQPIPGSEAGDLIWARPIDNPPAGSNGWLVLYRSESLAGDAIAVSGVVYAPLSPASDALPVVSYAHGTSGLADTCAPSKLYAIGGGFELFLAQAVTALGWTFVATDYEGLGTPGVHPYLVGQSEGRGVIDIVRAASQLDDAGVDPTSPVAFIGHSQGGHAALMAGELAATWAPAMNVVGTVALAPPGDIAVIETGASAAGDWLTGGFGLMIDAGYAAAYPDLPVEALVDDTGLDELAAVADTCTDEAFMLVDGVSGIQRDGTKNQDWAAAYDANSPGNVAPTAPVLIVHGDSDDIVPAVLSETIFDDYCALGANVERTVYAGADHGSVVTLSLGALQAWVADRFAGAAEPISGC
jgi:pimeloyl-ACP methyl ester carboxylesterase